MANPPSPIWTCHMRTPACRHGHPLVDIRDRSMLMDYRVDGHILQTCRHCKPSSYAFGIATKAHRLIIFYAVSARQMQELRTMPDDMDTDEILSTLGYGRTDAA